MQAALRVGLRGAPISSSTGVHHTQLPGGFAGARTPQQRNSTRHIAQFLFGRDKTPKDVVKSRLQPELSLQDGNSPELWQSLLELQQQLTAMSAHELQSGQPGVVGPNGLPQGQAGPPVAAGSPAHKAQLAQLVRSPQGATLLAALQERVAARGDPYAAAQLQQLLLLRKATRRTWRSQEFDYYSSSDEDDDVLDPASSAVSLEGVSEGGIVGAASASSSGALLSPASRVPLDLQKALSEAGLSLVAPSGLDGPGTAAANGIKPNGLPAPGFHDPAPELTLLQRFRGAPQQREPGPKFWGDFVNKCRLAWDVFFPAPPPESLRGRRRRSAAALGGGGAGGSRYVGPLSAQEVVKSRLKMVLTSDRCGLTPDTLVRMKSSTLRALEEVLAEMPELEVQVSAVRPNGERATMTIPFAAILEEKQRRCRADYHYDEVEDDDDYFFDDEEDDEFRVGEIAEADEPGRMAVAITAERVDDNAN